MIMTMSRLVLGFLLLLSAGAPVSAFTLFKSVPSTTPIGRHHRHQTNKYRHFYSPRQIDVDRKHCHYGHYARSAEPSLTTHQVAISADAMSSFSDNNDDRSKVSPIQDCLAGLTVAFSLLSKAIACSAIVGVNPLVGLWSSVVMGITAPLIGSRAGVISGTAAVVIVPLSALTKTYGVQYMPLCILVSALLQGLFGIMRLAKTARLVSEQVLSGFLNGLGFILLLSQAKVFKSAAAAGALTPAISMAALCFSIVQGLPRFTKAVPSSLVGLVVATVVGAVLKLPLATLASTAAEGTFTGGLSSLPRLINIRDLMKMVVSPSAWKLVMPAAISIMIIALVETLLAGKVVDDMTGEKLCPYPYVENSVLAPSDEDDDGDQYDNECIVTTYDVPTRSVLAMSAGNTISAFLGGFGGCGLIPQSVLNIKSGGGGPLSSASYAAAMAAFVVFFAPLVGKISEAALAGIMITVAYDTVAWGSSMNAIKAVIQPPSKYDMMDSKGSRPPVSRVQRMINLLTLGGTSYICYFGNLAVGIIAGVVFQRGLSALYRRYNQNNTKVE